MTEKEYYDFKLLEEQINHLRELMDARERIIVLEERIREGDKALLLQRVETDRRLGVLNGEHENIKQNQAKSVLREVYKTEQDEQDKKIQVLLDWKSNSEGRQAVSKWIAIIAVIIAAISLVLNILRKL